MMRNSETRAAAPAALLLTLALICGLTSRQAQAVAPSSSSSPVAPPSSPVAPSPSRRVAPAPSEAAPASPSKDDARGRVRKSFGQQKSFGQLPASFEVNAGQADARFKFLWRGSRHTLLLGADGATLLTRTGGEGSEGDVAASRRGVRGETAPGASDAAPSLQLMSMKFVGANPRAAVEGERELKGKANYFIGNDSSKWRTNVPTYAQVRYRNLYRGVDLVYHGGQGGLEYDFVLAPGADASSIRVRFEGAERLSVDAGGGLLLHTKAGPLRQSRPVLYQEVNGVRREVAGGYVLQGRNEIGFRVGEYDRTAPLVIDPVIVYSTYFIETSRMAVDPAGNVYVVGTVPEFAPIRPTPGAFQKKLGGPQDAFVAKLDAAGRELVYVTYLGGADRGPDNFGGWELGMDIAADAAGNAYVTGFTDSTDFPVANAFQPTHAGGDSDGFVTKLNASGSALVYSSFIGGSGGDSSRSIDVDAAGAAYLVGGTASPDFPTKNAFQPTIKVFDDYFVTKVAPAGSSLVYSTYLGGTGSEFEFSCGIAVDAAGAVYVVGSSDSSDYPVTPGAFQPTLKSPLSFHDDVVVTKFTPDGSALVYSTYLGGTLSEFANDIAVDAAGQAHVVGTTGSTDFPTQNELIPLPARLGGFLTKLNAAGTALVYSTHLAGTQPQCGLFDLFSIVICGADDAQGVATDAAGNAYVTGFTYSKDFPAPVNALQSGLLADANAYLIKLDPAGQSLFSTHLGGASFDYGSDVHADPGGTAYVLGTTYSHDFPLVNPYRDNFARELDPVLSGFLVKISTADPPDTASRLRFESASFAVDEASGSVVVGVTRAGDLSGAVTVNYTTGDQTATERSDYTSARGTLRFAPGETTKSFTVFVTDDRTVEGDETLSVTLHDLSGEAVLAAPVSATLTVRDDDDRPTSVNPIDDSRFFVRQHYLDFLGREPDQAGLDFWSNEIEQCGADAQCREMKRVNVSAAFFLSIEFQETGFLVERLYSLAFKRQVSYETFVRDARKIGEGVVVGEGDWQQRLAANRRAYADEFVARAAFLERYPEDMLPWDYVDALNANSGGSLSRAERDVLVISLEFDIETRASVLLKIADDQDFRRTEFNPAFVLMQYLGYLRRDPDEQGFEFWLQKLNQFGGDWRAAEMVRAFVSSIEYRERFNEPLKEASLGVPFTLGFRETAVVLPDKLRVTLRDIGFDTRCPRFAPCPSPGGVTILLGATRPGGDTARFTLRIDGGVPRPHTNNPPVSALGYRFRLLQVDPAPPFTTPLQPYEVLLQVEKE